MIKHLMLRLKKICDPAVDERLVAAEITADHIEEIIREEFEHFEAVNLTGDQNWRMRQKTGRLCEIIVVSVNRGIHDFAEGND